MRIERKIYVNNDLDIVTARLQAREMAKEMGFQTADQARISLATSELARVLSWNDDTPEQGAPSEIIMSGTSQNGSLGLQIDCLINREYAPKGNSDWAKETSGPSRSLAGACQLVDESRIQEQNGEQSQVTLIKWLK